MTPGAITAVSYLLSELLAAGISMGNIMQEVKKTGNVPPERWAEIIREIDLAESTWRNAPGPDNDG